jgi:hypothetical protein
MLPLRDGDRIAVDASSHVVKAGQVDPRALLKYSSRVGIFAAPDLHAKIYAFDGVAVVGSANVSGRSRDDLFEAAVEVKVSAAELKRVWDQISKRPLSRDDLRKLAKIYRPPKHLVPRAVIKSNTDRSIPFYDRADSTARVWYHGTFETVDRVPRNEFEARLPSLRRLRPGDWYIMVYRQNGVRHAAPPREVKSVDKTRGIVLVQFKPAQFDERHPVPAAMLEAMRVNGAPEVRHRWQLISERVPSDAIFDAFRRVRKKP